MSTPTNEPQGSGRLKEFAPSRPGIKFVLCAIAAVIAIFAIITLR